MQVKCPFADWRPLGPQTEPRISRGIPSVLIFHTMVGFLRGTDSMFKNNGYGGTESHFGVGGKYDKDLDGAIWQWQTLDHTADAQYTGNAYATSIETSDGTHPSEPWSEKQLDSLVKLGAWWCKETGNPARLVKAPTEKGFGYHQQFSTWNRAGHVCPGATRVHQLINDVIPRVNASLRGEDELPSVKEIAAAVWNHRMRPDDDPKSDLWEAESISRSTRLRTVHIEEKMDKLDAKLNEVLTLLKGQ